MAQKLQQELKQSQVQQLSTLQVALSSLVQLPLTSMAERIRNEMLDNAALEEGSDLPHDNDGGDATDDGYDDGAGDDATAWDEVPNGELRDSLSDYMNEDEVPAYLRDRADEQREQREQRFAGTTSALDDLQAQIGEHNVDEHQRQLLEYLIGSLDDDGLLRKDLDTLADELAVYHNVYTDRDELERALHILQTFEPRGIGARSLRECLLLQLDDPDLRSPYKEAARRVLTEGFTSFASHDWNALRQRFNLDDAAMDGVRHLLTHLNPRPGGSLGNDTVADAAAIVPDFFVSIGSDGLPDVSLNQGDMPELRISPAFRDSLNTYARHRDKASRAEQEAYVYARQKVEAAQTFISLVARRRATLLMVMRAIADLQRDFFVSDDDDTRLVPLTLREVASRAGVDISTVSRVVTDKYVETAYGIYPLKQFFFNRITTRSGDELSSREVKTAIARLIEGEDRHNPLADEAIATALQAQGLDIARRTVAKYREQMGVPVARLRRE